MTGPKKEPEWSGSSTRPPRDPDIRFGHPMKATWREA